MQWLLLSYRVPAQPSALRVATWRALKQVGAVLLGPGLYALPESPHNQSVLSDLSERIVNGGGAAITLSAVAVSDEDQRSLDLKFEAARHDEYQQVIKSARKFCAHVDQEDRDHDYRFAEVESLEEELNKVRRQLARVRERDARSVSIAQEAEEAVAAAEVRLQQYLDHAYQEENQE